MSLIPQTTTPPQLADTEFSRAMDAIAAKLDRYEDRIRSLEDDRLRMKAWGALIVFVGGLAAFLVERLWPK